MSETEVNTAPQSGALETDVVALTAEEAQPAAADQRGGATPLEEPPATPASSPDSPVEEEEKRAISPRKLAANRANAQRSTGPRTAEGKERSSQNAVTHGLTARYFPGVIQPGTKEGQEFEAVCANLHDYYQPQGALEGLLLAKVTIEYLRYRRLVEREHGFCAHNPGYFLEIVNKLARYQTAINNQLFQAIRELERLQAERKTKEAKERESDGSSD